MTVGSQTENGKEYKQLQEVVQAFRKQICKNVLNPIVRRDFENSRGNKLRETLPDRGSDYRFSSHGFEALVLPNKREITNHVYNKIPLTETQIIANADSLENIFDDALELWNATFGEGETHKHSVSHSGEFPMKREVCLQLLEQVTMERERVINNPSLDTIIELLREQNTPLLSRIFQIPEEDIYTPTASDISLIQGVDEFNLVYVDDEIALLNPVRSGRRSLSTPTRGLVVGFDDTPVGVFGHVIDTTNLNSDQTVTRRHIKQAMGFDDELHPYNPRERLDLPDGTRLRIQGDLRVEYTGDVENYSNAYTDRVRREEYRNLLDNYLSNIEITNSYLSQGTVQASSAIDYTLSDSGNVVVESQLTSAQATLVVFGELNLLKSTRNLLTFHIYGSRGYGIKKFTLKVNKKALKKQ